MEICTIGHSNQPLERFLKRLRDHGVATLVDVRSAPFSRFAHFRGKALQASLAEAGIGYVYLGDTLGGRPVDPGLYDAAGALVPARVRATPAYRAGLERLLQLAGAEEGRVCVMCAEEDPAHCHRTTLIAPDLEAAGATLVHIRRDPANEGPPAQQELALPD